MNMANSVPQLDVKGRISVKTKTGKRSSDDELNELLNRLLFTSQSIPNSVFANFFYSLRKIFFAAGHKKGEQEKDLDDVAMKKVVSEFEVPAGTLF